MVKFSLKNLRKPPDWQLKKLELASTISESNKEILKKLEEIRLEIKKKNESK